MRLKLVLENAVIAAAYVMISRLSFYFGIPPGNITPVWPVSGLALAALYHRGWNIWPGLWTGALLAHGSVLLDLSGFSGAAVSGATAAAIATVFTLESLLIAFFTRPGGPSAPDLNETRQVFLFSAVTAAFCAAGVSLAAALLCFGGFASWPQSGRLWLNGWMGDLNGTLLVTPLILAAGRVRAIRWPWRRTAEFLLLTVLLVFASRLIFGNQAAAEKAWYGTMHLLFPFFIWAAFRFDQLGTTTCLGLVWTIGIAGAAQGIDPAGSLKMNHALLWLQSFSGVAAVSGLALTAFVVERKEMFRSLKQAHSFLDSVIENIPSMIFIKEARELRFVRFNKAGEDLLGYTRSELLGKNDYDFFPQDEADFFTAKDREVLKSGALLDIPEEPIHTRLKGLRILHTRKIPILDRHGKPLYLVGISEDITEKKMAVEALAESQAYNRKLFELSPIGLALCRMDGQLVDVNEAYARIIGRAVEDTLKLTYWDITPEKYAKEEQRQLESLRETGRYGPYEKEYIHQSGRLIPVRLQGLLIEKDGEKFIWSSVEDISARKQAENNLKKMTADLGKIVEDRTRDLGFQRMAALNIAEDAERARDRSVEAEKATKQYAEDLNRSNKELEEFAYVASHDLQEPLRTIANYLTLLSQQLGSRLEPENARYLEIAVGAARRMKNLIDDLLTYSRVGAQKKSFEPTDCSHVVRTVLENLRTAIEEAASRVTVDPLPVVQADPRQMEQLFQNLIANAVKFRGESPSEVSVTAEENENEWVFCVRDNGIGIDLKHQEKIFLIFQRLHPRTRYPGTGIGLAICKKIIEQHGGRIWVESQAGQGAAFYFSLPQTAGQKEASSPIPKK
jgi:PAS domain S-box-containing protein